jgi:hypothetical protein
MIALFLLISLMRLKFALFRIEVCRYQGVALIRLVPRAFKTRSPNLRDTSRLSALLSATLHSPSSSHNNREDGSLTGKDLGSFITW